MRKDDMSSVKNSESKVNYRKIIVMLAAFALIAGCGIVTGIFIGKRMGEKTVKNQTSQNPKNEDIPLKQNQLKIDPILVKSENQFIECGFPDSEKQVLEKGKNPLSKTDEVESLKEPSQEEQKIEIENLKAELQSLRETNELLNISYTNLAMNQEDINKKDIQIKMQIKEISSLVKQVKNLKEENSNLRLLQEKDTDNGQSLNASSKEIESLGMQLDDLKEMNTLLNISVEELSNSQAELTKELQQKDADISLLQDRIGYMKENSSQLTETNELINQSFEEFSQIQQSQRDKLAQKESQLAELTEKLTSLEQS